MEIRLEFLQVMKDFKADVFLFSTVESLLDEIGLIKALASFLHVALQQLHTLFVVDFQALFAQYCPERNVIAYPFELDAEYALDKEALGDGKDGNSLHQLQKQVVESILVVVLQELPEFFDEAEFQVVIVAFFVVSKKKWSNETHSMTID